MPVSVLPIICTMINRNTDIIMFALPRWDQPISSPALSLAKEFAQSQRVFYIEHPYSVKDLISQRNTPAIRRRKEALISRKDIYSAPEGFPANLLFVTPPVTVPINFLPAGKMYDWIAKRNDQAIFDTIRKVIKDHAVREWIYFNSYDPFFARSFPSDLKPSLKVYQSMDDISQEPYTAKHGLRLEEDIVKKFDLILATSKELTRLKSAWNPNTFYHPNAADTTIFRKAVTDPLPRPKELQDIPAGKKVIGFTGSVEYRTDFELLVKLATSHKDKIILIVGPVFASEISSMGIDKMENVRFAGAKKIGELPEYLQHMDCVIIPYKCNTLTKSIYPLKINEYLGAGRPVIASHFSDDIHSFSDVAYIADSHEEFIALIDRAIDENSLDKRNRRTARAEENTWVARVNQFWDFVAQWEANRR